MARRGNEEGRGTVSVTEGPTKSPTGSRRGRRPRGRDGRRNLFQVDPFLRSSLCDPGTGTETGINGTLVAVERLKTLSSLVSRLQVWVRGR